MIKKILACYLSSFLICNPVLGSDILNLDGKISPVEEGDPAPFTGTLFDNQATASLIVHLQSVDESCSLQVGEATDRLKAVHDLEMGNLNLSLDTCKVQKDMLLQIKSDQILFLQDEIKKRSAPKNELWFAVGIVAGVFITGTAAWSINQVSNK